MASDVHVVVVGGRSQHLTSALDWIAHYEELWSRFAASSDISRLNRADGRPTPVDAATIQLVGFMIEAHALTGGRFDPSILPSLMAAGYTDGVEADGRVRPRHSTVAPTAATSSMPRITVDPGSAVVTLPPGAMLDAGGLGKGLAADLVVARLLSAGVDGALVDIGGDLAAAGTAPESCGWRIAVEDPHDADELVAAFTIAGGGVATSSSVSRRWTMAGVPMHHTIDPAAGRPSTTDLAAVTVVAPCGWLAEVHATALLLDGAAGVGEYAARHDIDVVAVSSDGDVSTTPTMLDLVRS